MIFVLLLVKVGFGQWQPANNGIYGGNIFALTVDPTTNYIYAGTSEGGIYMSTDNGSTWIAMNNGLSGNYFEVRSIAISGSNIYAGTNLGVYLSTNNGSSWTAVNNGLPSIYVNSIAISESNIFTAPNGNGVWKRLLADIGNLTVSKISLTVDDSINSTGTFNITSNTNWTVSSSETWLTASPNSGSDTATITLTAEANTITANRTAIITVSGSEVPDQTITVTQDGAAPEVTVSTNTLTIAAPENSTASIDVFSNTNWTVASSETWLAASPNTGTDTATVTLTAEANTATNQRAVVVTVTATGFPDQTIMVIQEGVPVGIDNSELDIIKIYPNPTKDYIFINMGDFSGMLDYSIKIVNMLGATVFETLIQQQEYEINLSTWSGKGVYLVKIYDNASQEISVRKIVLQ